MGNHGSSSFRSVALSAFQAPDARLPNLKPPILTRISRKAGCPMTAVMRRTCRFLPSTNSRPIQHAGTVLRKRMGGSRGGISGCGSSFHARQGSVARPCTDQPGFEPAEGLGGRNSFDLHPVFTLVRMARVE